MNTPPYCAVTAYHHDLTLDQGSTFGIPFEFYDAGNRPINFSGFTARMQVRRTPTSEIVIDELTSTDKDPRITFASNVMTLTWTKDETERIKPGRYFYDVEITAPNGSVSRLLEGAFIIRREVTR